MLDASLEALTFTEGRTRADLDTDRMFMRAVVKDIEIVGEAAASVSTETRQKHPQIRWKAIVGMRHRLIHGYFDINLDLVWLTLTDDLPPLIDQLRAILKSEEQSDG
jgi:uncharacterized protein with HEPN domain